MRTQLVPATIHGRVLVREVKRPRGLLVGFHGYMEDAEIQMARMQGIPGAAAWTLVSVQGLHRFYKGRSDAVVASWMTRQDRETMIADNIAYVDAALASVERPAAAPVVCAGFSQGTAMAFRAALRGRAAAAGVIAVGGDIPPELLADPAARFPPVLLVRGDRDDWYTGDKMDADVQALAARGAPARTVVCEGGHEWTREVSAAAGEWLRNV